VQEETETETMINPTGSDRRQLQSQHSTWPRLTGIAALMAVLFLFTIAANSVPQPGQISLTINGKMDGNGIPVGWELEALHNHHQINLEPLRDGQFGIRMLSEGNSFGLHKSVDVDLKEFPILSWRWKVDRLPPTGDIREKSKDDQAAQLYVVFPALIQMMSPTIGYLWDSNAPAGTIADGHNVMTPIKVIVLQSGTQRLGEWVQERRNVFEDYVKVFGKNSPPKVGRVAIWINTQHTKSSAEATFADLQFLRAK
jgi:hypothetical protein